MNFAADQAHATDVTDTAMAVEKLPRLTIDPAVCREVVTMSVSHAEILAAWFDGRVRFPSKKFWVEIPAVGLDPSFQGKLFRVGIVLNVTVDERLSGSLCFQERDGFIAIPHVPFTLGADGLTFEASDIDDANRAVLQDIVSALVAGPFEGENAASVEARRDRRALPSATDTDYDRSTNARTNAGHLQIRSEAVHP